MNVTMPPFDKQEAREAVNYAIDSNALVRVFGGRLQPGCNFLPAGVVGLRGARLQVRRLRTASPTSRRPSSSSRSRATRARRSRTGSNNKDPRPAIADYFRDVLNEIGFDADVKTLDQQVYFEQIGLKKNKAQTGFTDWFQDYPHPGDFIESLLSTRALVAPRSRSTRASSATRSSTRSSTSCAARIRRTSADQWAALDDYVVNEKAYVAPYGSEESSSFFSERMDAEDCGGVHPVYKNDWLLFCLK